MQRIDGGPAFPVVGAGEDNQTVCIHNGMRLVDFFAAHIAAGAAAEAFRDSRIEPRDVAKFAYQVAEAMVLKKKGMQK